MSFLDGFICPRILDGAAALPDGEILPSFYLKNGSIGPVTVGAEV